MSISENGICSVRFEATSLKNVLRESVYGLSVDIDSTAYLHDLNGSWICTLNRKDLVSMCCRLCGIYLDRLGKRGT
jgi:hypothetical protein